jgi:hypothetical protein
MMTGCLKNIFESHQPGSSGYTQEVKDDVCQLLKYFSTYHDQPESIKSVISYLSKGKVLIFI